MDILKLKAEGLIDEKVRTDCHVESSINNTTSVHTHDYYEIFIITDGGCLHKVNGENQILYQNDMVFIRPSDVHSYDFYTDEDCQFINVNFFADEAEDAFRYFENPNFIRELNRAEISPCVTLTIEDKATLVKRSEQIRTYTPIDRIKARLIARSFLIDAMTSFYLYYEGENRKAIPDWLDILLLQMQKKENFTYGLARLHKLSNKSSGHVNHSFKKYLNTTPTAYINRLKLGYAKNLIITTSLSMIDISLESGFDNLSHFYHQFHKMFGKSPRQLRNVKKR